MKFLVILFAIFCASVLLVSFYYLGCYYAKR